VRYLLDEMYPRAAAVALRDNCIDAVAIKELEIAAADDPTVLSWARDHRRVVVTENVPDFARLATTHDHCGIVMYPRTRFAHTASHIGKPAEALAVLAHDPPHGLGAEPVVWWLPGR
jgi:hypothetical protein